MWCFSIKGMKKIVQMFRFAFAAEVNGRADAIKVIYMRMLLKEGNEIASVLTYLGTRATFHWFIYVHSDMCAALLLFSLPSVCSGSQRKKKEEGKVKSQLFFYLHWATAVVLVPHVCLKEMRLFVGILRAQQVLMDTRKLQKWEINDI